MSTDPLQAAEKALAPTVAKMSGSQLAGLASGGLGTIGCAFLAAWNWAASMNTNMIQVNSKLDSQAVAIQGLKDSNATTMADLKESVNTRLGDLKTEVGKQGERLLMLERDHKGGQ